MMMQIRDRRHEMSPESYAYYMSRRGFTSTVRENERSASARVVEERGEYGWQWNGSGSGSGSGGGLRSRSPRPYHQETRREDKVDVEIGHRCWRSPLPLESRGRHEAAEEMTSPTCKGFRKYGTPTLQGAGDEYSTVDWSRMTVSDEFNMVRNHLTVEDSGIVRRHEDLQPALHYGETSRDFRSVSTSEIVDSRVQYVNHLSSDRSLNSNAYSALNLEAYNEGGKCPLSLRDTSCPVSSKSQVNSYANISPAYRAGGHIPPCCQGVQHIHSDDLHIKRSKVAEKSVFDVYDTHLPHYSTLDHQSNVKDPTNKMIITHGPTHHLKHHHPIVEEGENGELRHLCDRGYRDVHSGRGQTYRLEASGNTEADRFLSDEYCGHLHQHSRKDCYCERLSLNILNKYEDNYTSGHNLKDFCLSRRISHEKDMFSDPRSCCSHPEKKFHGSVDYDHQDPHFVTSSKYNPRFMASGTWVDDHHKHAAETNFTDSRADLVYNTEETRNNFMRTSYWSCSDTSKQADEEYYYVTRLHSSPEPREEHIDSEMYDPEVRREMNQCSQFIDMPPHEREHRDGRVNYRDSQMEWINAEVGSVYDVITSEYDMAVGRLDTNKQRWAEQDPSVRSAPSGMLKTKSVTFKRTNNHNLGSDTSHGRCNTNSSRYLPDWNVILVKKGIIIHPPELIGSDCTRPTGSRSIFDRLGSPRGSDNRFPQRRMQGHLPDFISRKSELRQSKGRRKSNYLTLNGSPHLNKGSLCYKQSKSSTTNTNNGHMKKMEDTDTLEGVDIPVNPASGVDTEDFKQSVQKVFLLISQKINENPATRRRYKDQGKAGTLFCIVCKRSYSKEFEDTWGLAAHSLTCQNSGLRAQHLGLFKAICVTMGWSTDIDQETVTWGPQVLPEDKALAQKEDLICWPPVFIVHNVSCLRKNHFHKVRTTEEFEAFLRSKGFITGRVKVCFGQSTNNHIMVVKFLGTYPGLKDAEKLHKHYAENKRGRVEFGKLACSNAKGSQPCGTVLLSDNAALSDLYGYMGIAEDWHKLDAESKKRCTIKSKQEILDFCA